MSNLLNVLLFALIPVTATVIGGIIASYRPPGPTLGSYLQHFAAGTVFAAVADELLPEVINDHNPVATIVGFTLGVVLVLLIRSLTQRIEATKDKVAQLPIIANPAPPIPADVTLGAKVVFPVSLLVTVGIDILIDGLLIGIGFSAGASQGILLTIALTLELVGLGLATSATISQAGVSRQLNIVSMVGLGLLLLFGAFLGTTLLSGLAAAPKDAVLAFGVAALLFLVTEELLVEAHEVPETPLITATFFFGFLLILIIGMLV